MMGIPPARPYVAVSVLCDGTTFGHTVCAGCVCGGGRGRGRVLHYSHGFFTTVMGSSLQSWLAPYKLRAKS